MDELVYTNFVLGEIVHENPTPGQGEVGEASLDRSRPIRQRSRHVETTLRQRCQNLWTKKGYDLAFKVRNSK